MNYDTMSGPEIAAEYNRLAKTLGKPEVKKFKDRATGIARLKQMVSATTRKNSRAKFGTNIFIQLATEENPRRQGTRAWTVFGKMKEYLSKRGKAPLSEVIAATGYRRPDFNWDLDRGYIKKVSSDEAARQ